MSWKRFFLVLAGFGSQRLLEVAYSRRNEAVIRRREPAAPRAAPSSFKWMVALNLALFTLPALETALRGRRPIPLPIARLGWAGAIGAVGLRWWVISTLRDAWNVRAIVPRDLRVVTNGPYRWVRHPNYVAVILEFAALPLIGGAYACAVLLSGLNGMVLRWRIRDEEALLDQDAEYRRLMGHKPRFFPRMAGAYRPRKRATHSRGVSRLAPQ